MESGGHRPSRGGVGTEVICVNLILIWTLPSLTRSRNLTNSGPKRFKGKNICHLLVYIFVLRKGLLNAINRRKTLSQHCGVPLALRPASAYRSYIQDIRHYSCRDGCASACRAAGSSSVHFCVVVELPTFRRRNLYWSQLTVLWLHCISTSHIQEESEEGTPFVQNPPLSPTIHRK